MRRVKIGVVGCGAIAQVHHLPNLMDLQNEFEVTAVCDLSPGAASYLADRYSIPARFTDYRQLLDADVEAVLLCQTDPKTGVALDAFEAGKHVFIEKPVCFSLQEADALIDAQKKAGTVAQAGYMKVYDPAFERAQRESEEMSAVRFVQINHLHPNNALHLRQFHLERFDDLPSGAAESASEARARSREEAIGVVSDEVARAFHLLAGSMIHDLYGLRAIMGQPEQVISSEIWREGRGVTVTLAYAGGARCVATWIDLPDLWDFRETLEIYGDDKRVLLAYPTGFSRGILSTLEVHAVDEAGQTYRMQPAIDWESPFVRELKHFHRCIVEGIPNRTPLVDARQDIALIIQIIERYLG